MAAEDGVVPAEALAGVQTSRLTWSEQVYGTVPSAEQFGITEAAIVNLRSAYDDARVDLIYNKLEPEKAQEFAGRVARLELATRGFCQSAGIDPEAAIVDILIGRQEKYPDVWEDALATIKAHAEAEGKEFNPKSEFDIREAKRICKDRWGKWQLKLSPDQHEILSRGRELYEAAIADGREEDDAVALASAGLADEGLEIRYPYLTKAGVQRSLDLSRYFGLKPHLQGIVTTSAGFEGMTGQDMRGSTEQFDAEIEEVVELRKMFSIEPGDEVGDPAKIVLAFADIDAFKRYIQEEHSNGFMSDEEYARYDELGSLDDLHSYIVGHVSYECLDLLVAAGGILHRIPADIAVAQADARADRDVYKDVVVPTMQDVLGPDVRIHPTHAAKVAKIAREELPGMPLREAVARVAPLVASVIGLANLSH